MKTFIEFASALIEPFYDEKWVEDPFGGRMFWSVKSRA